MQSSGRIKVADLNELLTCMLCNGYYIDATTIIECLHSFCKTCIVTYLQTNKYCPKCEVQVHKTRPLLNIRSDQTLQDIVYKVVPGLFKNEMKRRRDFYSQDNALVQGSIPSSSEKRGDVWGCDRLIFTPEDIISISLEYCPVNLPFPISLPTSIFSTESLHSNNDAQNQTHRRYLRCPAAITVYHLKKFLRAKYGLNQNKKLEVLYMHDILKDQYTLIDLAYIYAWKRNGPLRLFYKITDEANCLVPKTEIHPPESIEGVSLEVGVSETEAATSSTAVTLLATDAPVATAPSSRHPSPPPSPQMAAEPNYVKIDKPNSAALLNEQATKVHEVVSRKSNLKSSLSSSKVENMLKYKPYVALPILRNSDSYHRHKFYENSIHSDAVEMEVSEKNNASPGPKKKTVTFSVDLVQTFYENSRYKSSKHSGKSSIFRTSKVNRSPVESVMNMRNGILMGKRS